MRQPGLKKAGLLAMALFYIVAGINHFANSVRYIAIMPQRLPFQVALVYISGFFEILFGLLLLPDTTRRSAAVGIILLLIAVYPANIQMAINYYRAGDPSFWLTILRLPLQLVLIAWGYQYTKEKQ